MKQHRFLVLFHGVDMLWVLQHTHAGGKSINFYIISCRPRWANDVTEFHVKLFSYSIGAYRHVTINRVDEVFPLIIHKGGQEDLEIMWYRQESVVNFEKVIFAPEPSNGGKLRPTISRRRPFKCRSTTDSLTIHMVELMTTVTLITGRQSRLTS